MRRSIASIARNLDISQAGYFSQVFRQTYPVTPQAFRLQNNANYDGNEFSDNTILLFEYGVIPI
ncbi:Propanediol utilization: transcriptional regulation [Enterobacter sp. FY-07]|nr:Propanediol utilization: transcriptional regulation [Enterobacter sp. FY-07]